MSVVGRCQAVPVAVELLTRAAGMSVECRLEEWAESMAPSSPCAQLQLITTFRWEMRVEPLGAKIGRWNAGISSAGPI